MEPEVWDGSYEKEFHYVHLPDGTKVTCWPNAGTMNAVDGSGRRWRPEDKPLVSIQPEEESPIPTISRANAEKRRHVRVDPRVVAGLTAIIATGHGLQIDSVEEVVPAPPRVVEPPRFNGHPVRMLMAPGDKLLLERARAKRARRKKRKR
jgi:hypothetical protein